MRSHAAAIVAALVVLGLITATAGPGEAAGGEGRPADQPQVCRVVMPEDLDR